MPGMAFVDLYPFREEPPDDTYDIQSEGERDFSGRRVVYRLGYQSMEVQGLPDEISIGPVIVHQVVGPVTTQRTDIVQRVGVPLVFDKVMHTGIEVGAGLPMSICQLEDTFSEEPSDQQFQVWRDEALMALGILTAALDERIAQEFIFEDLIVFDAEGDKPAHGGDVRRQIRDFLPYPVTDPILDELRRLSTIRMDEGPVLAACRWYLAAVQGGIRPDAIVYFWIAIEGLLGEGRGPVPRRLKRVLEGHGFPVDKLPLSVGRLYGLRGDVVHKGLERPDHLDVGWGLLERMTRLLIRDRLALHGALWPLGPTSEVFRSPLREAIEESWTHPEVNFDVRPAT
jgi:hypothetical protein